jgi:hypothetical protein
MVVRMGLSIMAETLRQSGALPPCNAFFAQSRIVQFTDRAQSTKLHTTAAIESNMMERAAKDLSMVPAVRTKVEYKPMGAREKEIRFKMSVDPENVSQEDLDYLVGLVDDTDA